LFDWSHFFEAKEIIWSGNSGSSGTSGSSGSSGTSAQGSPGSAQAARLAYKTIKFSSLLGILKNSREFQGIPKKIKEELLFLLRGFVQKLFSSPYSTLGESCFLI